MIFLVTFVSDFCNMNDIINIIITDDQQLFRRGLKLILESEGFRVLAEASNGIELLRILEGSKKKADVILLDIELLGKG